MLSIPHSIHPNMAWRTGPGTHEVGMRVPTLLLAHRVGGGICGHHTSGVGHQRVVMKDELAERREESYWQDGILLCNL
jgi:hypothetical protein